MIPVINSTMELADCKDQWTYNKEYSCWCLEDVLYTSVADVPKFQRLSIFAPEACLHGDGTPTEESRSVPIVFENNAAGYMQMPHTWLGGPRCYAEQYLRHGLVYITCGCRGRESRNAQGELVGKAPISLIDLKTALRFLRHNQNVLPGDFNRIISVGYSAGGAMSALLGVTGDNHRYIPYLERNGAFMDESDAVFAAQIYCPIIDLEHADYAYEWMFGADHENQASHAGPAGTMSAFERALSAKLSSEYPAYLNSLNLRHPLTDEPLTLAPDGRSGSFFRFFMQQIDAAATRFLTHLTALSPEDYLSGNYEYEAEAPQQGVMHHAGPAVHIENAQKNEPQGLGELLLRPPKGVPYQKKSPPMMILHGADKRSWLSWDGKNAHISSLDDYILRHCRRIKGCPAFDKLSMDSAENHVFGTSERSYAHFNPSLASFIMELQEQFPDEAARYGKDFAVESDPQMKNRVFLLNPMNFIGTEESGNQAKFYRIRVGAVDSDTSFSIAMALALKLKNVGYPVDYSLIWDQPHCEADIPGEILAWIDDICASQGRK